MRLPFQEWPCFCPIHFYLSYIPKHAFPSIWHRRQGCWIYTTNPVVSGTPTQTPFVFLSLFFLFFLSFFFLFSIVLCFVATALQGHVSNVLVVCYLPTVPKRIGRGHRRLTFWGVVEFLLGGFLSTWVYIGWGVIDLGVAGLRIDHFPSQADWWDDSIPQKYK